MNKELTPEEYFLNHPIDKGNVLQHETKGLFFDREFMYNFAKEYAAKVMEEYKKSLCNHNKKCGTYVPDPS